MSSLLKIGEVASVVGVSRDTIRYYERLNLLPRVGRTQTGYRLYTEAEVARLRFIKQAQELGLSLDEIKEILPGRDAGLAECSRVRDLLSAKLETVDARLAQMLSFRESLASHLEMCEEALEEKSADCCPVLSEISHPVERSAKNFSTDGRKKAVSKKQGEAIP